MERHQLEHIIRAAADIADDDEIIVVGSQAILGAYPDAPTQLTASLEADVYPKNKKDRWNLIDGCIGELSPFHETYGYYAQGVDETTAVLPDGWQGRLIPIRNANTRFATGYCLEPHDLAVSKCVAGREKDFRFVQALLQCRYVEKDTLLSRLDLIELPLEQKQMIRRIIAGRQGVGPAE